MRDASEWFLGMTKYDIYEKLTKKEKNLVNLILNADKKEIFTSFSDWELADMRTVPNLK